jgi:hypothetical protein
MKYSNFSKSCTSVNNNHEMFYFRYCSEHARKALIARQKITSNSSPTDLSQKCLQGLLQYKRDPIKMEDQGSSRAPPMPGAEFGNPRIGDFRDLEKDIHPFRKFA